MVDEQAVLWPPSPRSGAWRGKPRLPLHLHNDREFGRERLLTLADWGIAEDGATDTSLLHKHNTELPLRIHCVNEASYDFVAPPFEDASPRIPSTCPALTRSSGRSRESDVDLKSIGGESPSQPARSFALASSESKYLPKSISRDGEAKVPVETDLVGDTQLEADEAPSVTSVQSNVSSQPSHDEDRRARRASATSDLDMIGEHFRTDAREKESWEIDDHISALAVRMPDEDPVIVRRLALEAWKYIKPEVEQVADGLRQCGSRAESPPAPTERQGPSMSHRLNKVLAKYEVARASTQGFKNRFPELDAELSTLPRRRSVDSSATVSSLLSRERRSSVQESPRPYGHVLDLTNNDDDSSSENGIYTPSTSDSSSIGSRSHSDDDLIEPRLDEQELIRRVERIMLGNLTPEPSTAVAPERRSSTSTAAARPAHGLSRSTATMVYQHDTSLPTSGRGHSNSLSTISSGRSHGRSISPKSNGSNDGDDGDEGNESPRRRDGRDPYGDPIGLGCPFYIRNPSRFNVHDYLHCSKQWKNMALLKRHLRAVHMRPDDLPFKCTRCKESFPSQSKLDQHTEDTQVDSCPFVRESDLADRLVDPEDGISSAASKRLLSRRRESAIHTWSDLWHLLFPMDRMIPSPVPRSSSEVIADSFRRKEPELIHAIDSVLREYLEATLSQRLAGRFTGIFQDHINNTLKGSSDGTPGHGEDHSQEHHPPSVPTPAPSRRPSTAGRRWSDDEDEKGTSKKRKERHLDVSAEHEAGISPPVSPQMIQSMRYVDPHDTPDIRVWDAEGRPRELTWDFSLV